MLTRGIEILISQFETVNPSWSFLLSSGYENHPESEGKKWFCHLMAPDFEGHQDDPAYDITRFGDTAYDAVYRAIYSMLET